MTIQKELHKIQQELKAPKGQRNSFGKYNYRSCEDILTAVKPLFKDNYIVTCSDEVVNIGQSNYIKATAIFEDGESSIKATGFAREAVTKKGMDDAQITGAASSYARKYALNGLFAIDDTKDADTNEVRVQADNTPSAEQLSGANNATEAYLKQLVSIKTLQELQALQVKHKGFLARIRTEPAYSSLNKVVLDKTKELKLND